jgi:hypothetical protein
MAVDNKDTNSTRELIEKPISPTLTTEYFTIKGKGEWLDDNGQPRVKELSSKCYAFRTGTRIELRISDNGEFINPFGLPQRNKSDRFIPVSKGCFELYLNFLKTGQEKYLLQAKRQLI